jgi:anti-sigma regulatory factor (Ser/Thr protein kinase)
MADNPHREPMKHARRFPHEPESVPAARRFATSALRDVSRETLESVELMVSELATNCIRHTDCGFELVITRTGSDIRVEATDRAGGTPRMRSPAPTDPTGRGLKIVDMLSAEWGVDRGEAPGKTVWFTVPDTAPTRHAFRA